jgi:hypothetical protein
LLISDSSAAPGFEKRELFAVNPLTSKGLIRHRVGLSVRERWPQRPDGAVGPPSGGPSALRLEQVSGSLSIDECPVRSLQAHLPARQERKVGVLVDAAGVVIHLSLRHCGRARERPLANAAAGQGRVDR